MDTEVRLTRLDGHGFKPHSDPEPQTLILIAETIRWAENAIDPGSHCLIRAYALVGSWSVENSPLIMVEMYQAQEYLQPLKIFRLGKIQTIVKVEL